MVKKIVVVDTDTGIQYQIQKIASEYREIIAEFKKLEYYENRTPNKIDEIMTNAQLETLDLFTAVATLIDMLDIPDEVWKQHYEKMLGYQTDPTRLYKIKKVIEF